MRPAADFLQYDVAYIVSALAAPVIDCVTPRSLQDGYPVVTELLAGRIHVQPTKVAAQVLHTAPSVSRVGVEVFIHPSDDAHDPLIVFQTDGIHVDANHLALGRQTLS
jgi:hypothetical protein